ncbi:hypothetical protein AB0P00_17665 [Microbacterium sp. NPDC077057]|uniref:hypothetical protein n=2 Tax=Actinomycetes TaxID=1760 RepID=UPI003446EA74
MTMPMTGEELDLRIIVARIEGMLTATLARHDQRLDQHEGTLNQHEARLNDKGKTLARHDERLNDLEEDSAASWGRITGVLALLVAAGGVLWNVITP